MDSGKKPVDAELLKEVRVAVVLNGGVSLAVWIGGVTHELNLVRLASRGAVFDGRPADEGENAVVGVWKEILDFAKRRVEIDIIAGTSAGGLNGAFLAAAIAGGTSPPHMGQKWAQLADLASLADPPEEGVKSLLNGTYFQDQIRSVLTQIRESPSSSSLEGDCTLLITATAVRAPSRPRLLERNKQASVVDSRRVYRFEHWRADPSAQSDETGDGDRKAGAPAPARAPDAFADVETLTQAARASASFPVAFEQVRESAELYKRRTPLYLADDPGVQRSLLMDGGVLDNAPFEPLLEALLDRPVSTPFDRTLLYVTPSVETVVMPSTGDASQTPDIVGVFGALLAAVREPDQRLDDDALRDAFRLMGYAVSQPHSAIQELLTGKNSNPADYRNAAASLFSFYQRGRNEALERQFAELGSPTGRVWRIPDAATNPPLRPGIPQDFAQPDGHWTYGLPVADRVLRWWGRALVAAADAEPAHAQRRFHDSMLIIGRAQRRITELKDEYHRCMQAISQQALIEPDQIAALQGFYNDRTAVIQETVHQAANAVAACFSKVSATELIAFSLAVEIVSSVHSWGASRNDVPRFRYVNLTPAAQPIVKALRELEKQASWPKNKLQGERLQHFGAFASESGRWYDWTWGRLDGASALFDQIVSERLASSEEGIADRCEDLRRKLADAILAAEKTMTSDLRAETERVLKSGPYDILERMPQRNQTIRVLRRNAQTLVRNSRMNSLLKFTVNRLIGMAVSVATTTLTVTIARTRLENGVRRLLTWPGRIFRRSRH
ncbi:MAG TPA: DUF3376 domain-containing protein [Jatrophihabitans sp.]